MQKAFSSLIPGKVSSSEESRYSTPSLANSGSTIPVTFASFTASLIDTDYFLANHVNSKALRPQSVVVFSADTLLGESPYDRPRTLS